MLLAVPVFVVVVTLSDVRDRHNIQSILPIVPVGAVPEVTPSMLPLPAGFYGDVEVVPWDAIESNTSVGTISIAASDSYRSLPLPFTFPVVCNRTQWIEIWVEPCVLHDESSIIAQAREVWAQDGLSTLVQQSAGVVTSERVHWRGCWRNIVRFLGFAALVALAVRILNDGRRQGRLWSGQCMYCGYMRGASPLHRCPECGRPRPER